MALAADPAGIFDSDAHRRVLAHLSTPEETYGWTPVALVKRVGIDDPCTDVTTLQEIEEILNDLAADGHAESFGGAWRQTETGFAVLTGPIKDEPGPDPDPSLVHPAMIGVAPPPATGPTPIGATPV